MSPKKQKQDQTSQLLSDENKKAQITKAADKVVFKVEYENMEPNDKLDYLRVQISESEQVLRERTDRALQSQKAFDAIMQN